MEWKLCTLEIVKVSSPLPTLHSHSPAPALAFHHSDLDHLNVSNHFQQESQYLRTCHIKTINKSSIPFYRVCDGSDDMSNEILWKWNRAAHEFRRITSEHLFQFILSLSESAGFSKAHVFSFFFWLLPRRWFQFSRCICTDQTHSN